MTEKLQLDEPADNVARLTINNPDRRGALDHELLDALGEHTRTLDARCLVIRGSGPVSCPRTRAGGRPPRRNSLAGRRGSHHGNGVEGRM